VIWSSREADDGIFVEEFVEVTETEEEEGVGPVSGFLPRCIAA